MSHVNCLHSMILLVRVMVKHLEVWWGVIGGTANTLCSVCTSLIVWCWLVETAVSRHWASINWAWTMQSVDLAKKMVRKITHRLSRKKLQAHYRACQTAPIVGTPTQSDLSLDEHGTNKIGGPATSFPNHYFTWPSYFCRLCVCKWVHVFSWLCVHSWALIPALGYHVSTMVAYPLLT